MPNLILREYLESQGVKYTVIRHEPVYTAQETAASAHIPGNQLAKTVMVKLDGKMSMAVLPASDRVNFDRFRQATGSKHVELASEREFKDLFPDCELGAMPPFGDLYGMQVYAAQSLADEIEIAFCAGSHSELIRIAFDDFRKLSNPTIFDFSWKE
jgi:Ala-tRNA(Pro) deacylase